MTPEVGIMIGIYICFRCRKHVHHWLSILWLYCAENRSGNGGNHTLGDGRDMGPAEQLHFGYPSMKELFGAGDAVTPQSDPFK
jgi:hypothetical protein